MILSLELENFRGLTATYDFGNVNLLSGRNGAKKSSIKEAIAFAFTGADSSGNRAPVHLISWGESTCRVTVKTDKASVSRTLTDKKISAMKLVRGEIVTSLTQTQFEQMLGASSDLFLAVFTPGYFWTIPLARQQAVLTEVTPAFDVLGFLEHTTQGKLEDSELIKFKFAEKRPDIVASAIANERRELQRQLDFNAGCARPIVSTSVNTVEEPQVPEAEIAMLRNMEVLKQEWASYRHRMQSYNSAKQLLDVTIQTNEMRRKRRAEVETELAGGGFNLAPTAPFQKEKQDLLAQLRASFKSKPQSPQLVNEVDSANCPTCGQVVGVKHRERVRGENSQRNVEYENILKEFEAYNRGVQEQINNLLREEEEHRERIKKIEEANNLVKRRKSQLEGELSGLTDIPVSLLPAAPEAPATEYDPQRESGLHQVIQRYNTSLSEYRFAQQVLMEQSAAIADIERNSQPLLASRDRLFALEEAVKAIPSARLERQTAALTVPGFNFIRSEDSAISLTRQRDNCPLALLSTGETINVNILFALRLNSLMKRPVGVMFIDNADLVDSLVRELYGLQVFEAYVVEDLENLVIEIKS